MFYFSSKRAEAVFDLQLDLHSGPIRVALSKELSWKFWYYLHIYCFINFWGHLEPLVSEVFPRKPRCTDCCFGFIHSLFEVIYVTIVALLVIVVCFHRQRHIEAVEHPRNFLGCICVICTFIVSLIWTPNPIKFEHSSAYKSNQLISKFKTYQILSTPLRPVHSICFGFKWSHC